MYIKRCIGYLVLIFSFCIGNGLLFPEQNNVSIEVDQNLIISDQENNSEIEAEKEPLKEKKETIKLSSMYKDSKDSEAFNDPIAVLMEKKQNEALVIKERNKKLHESALAYSTECHNNLDIFQYRFAQNADPVVNFLKTASQIGLRIDSLFCAIRILSNSMKSCEYIRDCSLNSLLKGLEDYAGDYFENDEDELIRKKAFGAIERSIFDFVSDHSELAGFSPGSFSSSLSSRVLKIAEKNLKNSQRKEWQDRLGVLMHRLLETSIGKTLWDVQDYNGIWDSVMTSANELYQLSSILVHMDDLDDLYWSLTHRFNWFLDFSAGQLPVAFYEGIEESIKDGSAFFLVLKEQDAGIKTKKELLLESINKAKSKAIYPELFALENNQELILAKNSEPEAIVIKKNLEIAPIEALFENNEFEKQSILAKTKGKKTKLLDS